MKGCVPCYFNVGLHGVLHSCKYLSCICVPSHLDVVVVIVVVVVVAVVVDKKLHYSTYVMHINIYLGNNTKKTRHPYYHQLEFRFGHGYFSQHFIDQVQLYERWHCIMFVTVIVLQYGVDRLTPFGSHVK